MRGRFGGRRTLRGARPTALVLPAVLGLTLVAAGCGAVPAPAGPTPTPVASSTGPTSASPPAAPLGPTLRSLGFTNGPLGFTVPPDSRFVTAADQPNVVTLVLSAPGPGAVGSYLRASLSATGFSITDDRDQTLTFTGQGWTGAFTASGATSAIVLRPA